MYFEKAVLGLVAKQKAKPAEKKEQVVNIGWSFTAQN